MKIETANEDTAIELWAQVEPRVRGADQLEGAAQALADVYRRTFQESVTLARVFVTVPFGDLPTTNVKFVEDLASSAGGIADLKPSTPVLSLIGTQGKEKQWGDRRQSEGHVGIPLISSSFVSAIPMIARLLKEIGVPLEWVDSHDSDVVVNALGQSTGIFYVEDAAAAVDEQGRKIIAAQDFVERYGITSVFGMSGAYETGQILVLVVFCHDAFSRESITTLAMLDNFIQVTSPLLRKKLIFSDS